MKNCAKCGVNKPLDDYWRDRSKSDGHRGGCKACYQTPEFLRKESARKRELYITTNGVLRPQERKGKEPWGSMSVYKHIRKKLGLLGNKFLSIHHWSYATENLEDVFVIERKFHYRLHTKIKRVNGELFFRVTETGEALNSRDKHWNYMDKFRTMEMH